MQLLPRPTSKAVSAVAADQHDPALPVILEYQSPSVAVITMPMPRIARGLTWTLTSMIAIMLILSGVIRVDEVVTAKGLVVSKVPTMVVQPLDTAIVRSIDVKPGEVVHAGQILARLDPTFAAADMNALVSQVSSLQAQVTRMQAELAGRPFTYAGSDPNMALQATMYAQRQAEFSFKMENYNERIAALQATLARARSDIASYKERLAYAIKLESMRKELERLNVGSKINTLAAMDTRAQMQDNLATAEHQAAGAQRDLAAMVAERNGFVQSWRADISNQLTTALSQLSEARDSLDKARLHRQLVELRAEKDATVMSISKISVGSVLSPGQQLMTLVPTDAPLEVEANIPGSEDGHVQVGDPVNVKFDTFSYTLYGSAHGIVRFISPDSFSAEDEARNPTSPVPLPPGSTGVWYRSNITLKKIALHNVPKGFHLIPGMPVTADIRVGKQSILHYMIGRYLPVVTNGMREP